ncbi:MAG TPA: hypothetical protein VMU37_07710 [Caulobacteraceae bacterium]|nr:hypothetical protein [Caulobacteraceae bacterium]
MLSWMFFYPTWAMALLFGVTIMMLALGGMFLLRPFFHRWIHGQTRTNEMVSLSMASFSVFYGILLGLVAVGVYANFAAATDNITQEASSLAGLYTDASALSEPHRSALLADLRAYAKETIENDWPAQSQGLVPDRGTSGMALIQKDLQAVHPTEKSDEIAYAEAFGQFEKLVELRSNRLTAINAGIPFLLWWVLWIGAILSVGLVWMLDMEMHIHAILTAVLSLFLGIVIFVIVDLDKPFRGVSLVGPDSYELVYHSLMGAAPGT